MEEAKKEMREIYKLKVEINAKRPDFRIFGSYFFGDDLYDYDSEGDGFTVTSKDWTELYMKSRKEKDLFFDIIKINEKPLIFEVSSYKAENVYRIAYFLARETNGLVLSEQNQIIELEKLLEKMGDFNLKKRLEVADNSIWRKATDKNPYPNLNEV